MPKSKDTGIFGEYRKRNLYEAKIERGLGTEGLRDEAHRQARESSVGNRTVMERLSGEVNRVVSGKPRRK